MTSAMTTAPIESREPWLRCNCALIPPTMPTCRGTHLRSCPMYVYEAVVQMERDGRDRLPDPVCASQAITAGAIRVLMEGVDHAV